MPRWGTARGEGGRSDACWVWAAPAGGGMARMGRWGHATAGSFCHYRFANTAPGKGVDFLCHFGMSEVGYWLQKKQWCVVLIVKIEPQVVSRMLPEWFKWMECCFLNGSGLSFGPL